MAFTYLISETFIKERTPLDANVDQKVIKPLIRDAQMLYIRRILGTDLYTKIVADALANAQSGTPIAEPYKTLLNTYVVNILMFRVMVDLVSYISIKERNNGLLRQGNEAGSSASLTEIQRIADNYKKKAEAWEYELNEWLCAKSDDLPEYTENDDDGDFAPEKSHSAGGIYLG
jgi:hypothetical protein